jgi:hypothetical protein
LAGWPHIVDFGGDPDTDRTGGPEQRNPATLPELYAGFAATHFFSDGETAFADVYDPSRECTVYASSMIGAELADHGRSNGRYLTWTDLPGDAANLRRALGRHIRFCHVYRSFFRDALTDDRRRRGIRHERWYQRLARAAMEERRDRDPKAALDALGEYCNRVLIWWGGIDQVKHHDDLPRALIDSGPFARIDDLSNNKYTRIVLKDDVEDTDSWNRFTHMVKGEEARPLSLTDIFRALNNAAPSTSAQGIGRFVQALYDACDAEPRERSR